MSRWNLGWLLGVSTAALIGLSLTYAMPKFDSDLQAEYKNYRLIVDVFNKVDKEFVEELDQEKKRELVVKMVNSYLQEIDHHSSFIPEDAYTEFKKQNRGSFGGIGIVFGVKSINGNGNGEKGKDKQKEEKKENEEEEIRPYVRSPIPGTPAFKAGIEADDIIMKIDGKDTKDLDTKDIIDLLAGHPGEKVVLSVKREGHNELIDIPIVRDRIRIESVVGHRRLEEDLMKWDYMIDPKKRIGYIRIKGFTQTTVRDLTEVVKKLYKQNVRGLIIDLRDNPGGLLPAAVGVSSLFLPEGKTVVKTKSRTEKEQVHVSEFPEGYTRKKLSIVILVDGRSASASEIVAAALQDWGVAIIIGERTYGKGSVQNVWDMEGGKTALKLTTAIYWRPNGGNIDKKPHHTEEDVWGVKPNKGFRVDLTDEERERFYKWWAERDIVRKKGREKELPKELAGVKDRILEKGIEYLRSKIKDGDDDNAAKSRPIFRTTFVVPPFVGSSLRDNRMNRVTTAM